MEFGKIAAGELSQIDFTLPSQDPRVLNHVISTKTGPLSLPESVRIGVGCPAWNVKSWVEKVDPMGRQASDFLFHCLRQFNSIELNTNHYRIPDSATLVHWKEAVPPDFLFNPKVLQEISHRHPLSSQSALTPGIFRPHA